MNLLRLSILVPALIFYSCSQKKDEKPLFTLKPDLTVAIIPMIFNRIIFFFFIGVIAWAYQIVVKTGTIYTLIIMAFLYLLSLFFSIMNLRARKYIFFEDRAEFYEGFLNIVQRTVRYTKVTDHVLYKTVWDRIFGTGTIKLVTAGHETVGRYSTGSGVVIQYVRHPDEVYKKLEALLKKH